MCRCDGRYVVSDVGEVEGRTRLKWAVLSCNGQCLMQLGGIQLRLSRSQPCWVMRIARFKLDSIY